MLNKLNRNHLLLLFFGILAAIYIINYYISCNRNNKYQFNSLQQIQSVPKTDALFTLYNFYSPTCGYCKKFWPAWRVVADKLSGSFSNIQVEEVNATDPSKENLAFYYNVQGYPTVILVTPDKNIEYVGDRSVNDLYEFVLKHTGKKF